MPPDSAPDPDNPLLSRDLFDHLFRGASVLVFLLLMWLSWRILSRLMSPEWQQERRSRAIRKAVASREARRKRFSDNNP